MQKKITLFVMGLAVAFGGFALPAHACSIPADVKLPTAQEVLDDDGVLFIGKILNSGSVVVGEVLETKEGTVSSHVVMRSLGTSCDNRFHFDKDEYFVVVAPKDQTFIINHMHMDKQFSFFYGTLAQAQAAVTQIQNGEDPAPANQNRTYAPAGYTLRPGMRGDAVLALQKGLNSVLPTIAIYPPVFPANPDGVYGNQTTQAVKMFQAQAGLTQDGIAGPKTQQALAEATIKIHFPISQ